jgi:hypothetical protein
MAGVQSLADLKEELTLLKIAIVIAEMTTMSAGDAVDMAAKLARPLLLKETL